MFDRVLSERIKGIIAVACPIKARRSTQPVMFLRRTPSDCKQVRRFAAAFSVVRLGWGGRSKYGYAARFPSAQSVGTAA
jgi:hypothetical protein